MDMRRKSWRDKELGRHDAMLGSRNRRDKAATERSLSLSHSRGPRRRRERDSACPGATRPACRPQTRRVRGAFELRGSAGHEAPGSPAPQPGRQEFQSRSLEPRQEPAEDCGRGTGCWRWAARNNMERTIGKNENKNNGENNSVGNAQQ